MNTNLKFPLLALVAAFTLTTATAQKERKERKERSDKKSQTITIVRSGDQKDFAEKMTIVVDGDKITINGKPIEEFKDGDVKVIANGDHFKMMGGDHAWSSQNGLSALAPLAAISGTGGDNFFSWNANSAFLGVTTEDVEGGAKITELTKDGAAEKAGLKVGDIITKMGDNVIEDAGDVSSAVGKFKPEDKVTITYKRDGKEQTASATLQKNEHSWATGFASTEPNYKFNFENGTRAYSFGGRQKLGLQIEDLEDGTGVKVLDVNSETPAAKAGIQKDDVITSFNGKEIKSVDDLRTALREVKEGETVKVSYKRGGSAQTAEIKFPKPVKKASL